eukprot:gene120-biopygen3427
MTSTSTTYYCVYCNVDIDPYVDYVSELSCTYTGCGRLTYHKPIPISVSKNVIEAYSPPKVTEVSIMDFIFIKPLRTMSKRGFSKQLYVYPVVEQQKPVHEEFPPLPTYHASRSLTPTEPPMGMCATEDEEMCATEDEEMCASTLRIDSYDEALDTGWIRLLSGHGTKLAGFLRHELDGFDECLVPSDFRLIPDDYIAKVLSTSIHERVIVFVADCCHSGTISDLPFTWTDLINERSAPLVENKNEHGRGQRILAISGCRDDQTSADALLQDPMDICSTSKEYSGAMTTYLLQALKKDPTLYNNVFKLRRVLFVEQPYECCCAPKNEEVAPALSPVDRGKPAMENAVHDMLHDMVASRLHDREDARHVHAIGD